MVGSQRSQIVDALWSTGIGPGVSVWVVLDAARDHRIYGAVDGSRLNRCCLYSGVLPWQMQMAAPYLLELERDHRFTKFLIDEGWGNGWGVFLRTGASIKQLRRHLHGLLLARDERGGRFLFRWYDPRVLRAYLPTSEPGELEQFYGPVQSWALEGEDRELVDYLYDGRQLIASTRSAGFAGGRSGPSRREQGRVSNPDQSQGMMTVRNAQMKVLAVAARQVFERRASDHLASFFPDLPECADRRQLLARVRRGVEEARLYGIESERDLLRWLNVAAALGEDFAENPRYPWAARVLSSPLSPSSKMERLSKTALEVVHDLEMVPTEPPVGSSGGEFPDDEVPREDEELEEEDF